MKGSLKKKKKGTAAPDVLKAIYLMRRRERGGKAASFPHCTKWRLCAELGQSKRKGLKEDKVPPARKGPPRRH